MRIQRFLVELFERPGSSSAIFFHWWPSVWTKLCRRASSSALHPPRLVYAGASIERASMIERREKGNLLRQGLAEGWSLLEDLDLWRSSSKKIVDA